MLSLGWVRDAVETWEVVDCSTRVLWYTSCQSTISQQGHDTASTWTSTDDGRSGRVANSDEQCNDDDKIH